MASLADNPRAIKPKLDQIAASEDPFGEALVIATCYGLTNIAKQAEQTQGDLLPASAQAWEDFLNQEVAKLLPFETASAI